MANKKHKGIQQNNNETQKEGKKEMLVINIASLSISLIAAVISIVAVIYQISYADKEYRYKLEPEIEPQGSMRLQVKENENGHVLTSDFSSFTIEVMEKNNLQAAYLIYSDDEVEKLELNNMEQTLEAEIKKSSKLDNPDIVVGDISYNYRFLFLKDMDGGYRLSLFYIKSQSDQASFHDVSEIEIWELEKGHPNDNKYVGEKQMAAKYVEVLKGCEKYIS